MTLRPDIMRDRVTAGKRDRTVIVERYSETYDEWNQPIIGWAVFVTEKASKTDVSDTEKLRAAQVGGSVTTRFVLRYTAKTASITAADRIRCEGTTYAISGTKELGTREAIEITAARPNDNLVPVEPGP